MPPSFMRREPVLTFRKDFRLSKIVSQSRHLDMDFAADVIKNAWAANTDSGDLFVEAPASLGDIMGEHRRGRFSIGTPASALQDIADGKGYGIVHNAEYGDIEYPLGRMGKRGMGLAHIVESRMAKDGATLDEALDVAIKVAAAAESGRTTTERYNTKHLDKDGVRAIVAFMPDGSRIVTGYEISAVGAGGANRRSPRPESRPHVSLEGIVAALKDKLSPSSRIVPHPGPSAQGGAARFSVGGGVDAAARREYDGVVARYTNADGSRKPGWMKAPNGKPTNLMERQWVQVRTPAFKRWFGDWEKAERLEKLRAAATLSLDWSGTYGLNQKSARQWMLDNIRDRYENRDTGDMIRVSRDGVKKATSHGMYDEAHLKSMSIVPQLIRDSIFIDEMDATSADKKYDKYRYYVAGVRIDGEDYTAKVVVGMKSGEAYYDHNLTKIEKGNLIDALNKVDNPVAQEISLNGANDTKLLKILQPPSAVSKVVDANGEPLVVYHGTNATEDAETWNARTRTYDTEHRKFTVFRRDAAGGRNAGHFFSDSADVAGSMGGEVYAVHLAMRSPLVVDAQGRTWGAIPFEGGLKDANEVAAYAEAHGHDGLILRNVRDGAGVGEMDRPATDYVVFGSRQVKSATDNAGAFDAANPDIRFSIGRLYTGSAADYERPSLHFVGTGEGSQVYGWGLYASNRRGIAEEYAESITESKQREKDAFLTYYWIDGERISDDLIEKFEGGYTVSALSKAMAIVKDGGDKAEVADAFDRCAKFYQDRHRMSDAEGFRRAARFLREHEIVFEEQTEQPDPTENVYEQTFFTDRAPGDESHLLNWYEPVSEEQLTGIGDGASRLAVRKLPSGALNVGFERDGRFTPIGVEFANGLTGGKLYGMVAKSLGSPKAASEFLARAGIDGVKYPADSYGGKVVKDGDEAGWNYVSFRDDNIRVDHKWTDGQMRFSVARDLVDAMRKRSIMKGMPVEGMVQPWPEKFPKIMLQTTLASIKQKWPELHARAKAGSEGAAIELLQNILGEERIGKKLNPKWARLRALADAHPRAIVVPVHAEEATGRNRIPLVYAHMIGKIAGLRIGLKIVQTVRANHTGANAIDRMTRRAAFGGPVVRGGEYILVDDHVTQGGTLNELRKFIQSHGGKVVAATTLTASQFSDTISISRDAMEALYAKFGSNIDEQLRQAGIANGVAELTQSQARELRKLRTDTLRDRLAAARHDREQQAHLRGVGLGLREGDRVSGYTDLLPGFKDYYKPDGTPTETGTRWAKASQFQCAIGRELNSIIDEALLADGLSSEETVALLNRLIASVEATDEIRGGVLPNFRRDSSTDDPEITLVGPDGRRRFTPERKAIQQQVYDTLMDDTISGANNEALETRPDGAAKEESLIVSANEGRPDLPPIPLQNPTYVTRKDFRIDIIVGPPAAGKSSVFANALSVWYRSRVLDCDACKKGLPGFSNGNGANYVHAESSRLNKRMIYDVQHRAEGDPRRGENIVLPVLGDDTEGLRKKVREWKAAGYTVYLHNNRVPILHAFGRAILRTLATGRWINPLVIRACLDNPTSAYNEVKKEADYYDQFSNDVNIGEKPVWEDGNYLDPAYGDVRRLDGQDAERGEANGTGTSGRLGRTGLVGRPTSRNGQYVLPGFERFSVAAPSDALFPQLRSMSDEELVTAAVAVKMALGAGGKVSDRAVKVNTVNKMIRRLHPEYKTSDVGRESLRVISDARKFAKRIRKDLDRGVSESLVLRHLPDTAREQFGREMDEEARRGQRLGRFGQKVAGALEERQARIVEDAVRVQTGIDVSLMENAYGINLSEPAVRIAQRARHEVGQVRDAGHELVHALDFDDGVCHMRPWPRNKRRRRGRLIFWPMVWYNSRRQHAPVLDVMGGACTSPPRVDVLIFSSTWFGTEGSLELRIQYRPFRHRISS